MENRRLDQMFQTQVVIWGALLMSQVMFLVMLFFIKPTLLKFDLSQPLFGGGNAIVLMALGFAGVMSVLMSFMFRSQFTKQAIHGQDPAGTQTGLVLGLAMCEACALIGFVVAMAFDYQYFFLWFAISLVATLFHFPRRGDLEATSSKKM